MKFVFMLLFFIVLFSIVLFFFMLYNSISTNSTSSQFLFNEEENNLSNIINCKVKLENDAIITFKIENVNNLGFGSKRNVQWILNYYKNKYKEDFEIKNMECN